MTFTLIVLSLLLLLVAVGLLVNSRNSQSKLVYTDLPSAPGEVLVSFRYGLKGKPDTILRLDSGAYIPIERKSRRAPKQPYESDVIQAGAYGLLIEECYGSAPSFLRIEYQDRSIDVPFTSELRDSVIAYAHALRTSRGRLPDRSHNVRAKCVHCVQRVNCNQGL